MILTFSHSKECFCRFVAKSRCCQVFFHRKRSSPVCGLITLTLTVSHSNETDFLPKSKIAMSSPFFALETVFSCSKLMTLFSLKSEPQQHFCFTLVIYTLFSLIAPKTLFVFVCCSYPVFTFLERKLFSWPFLGQLTDFSSI